VARWGDRGVLRSYSPVTTIGGFVVGDPNPPARPRRPRALADRMASDPLERTAAFVALQGDRGLPVGDLAVRVGIHPARVREVAVGVIDGGVAVRVSDRLIAPWEIERARTATLDALRRHHAEAPLADGMPREALRAVVGADDLANHVHEALVAEGAIVAEGGTARLSEHRPTLTDDEARWLELLRDELEVAGPRGCSVAELAGKIPEDAAARLLQYLVRQDTALRVGRERYYDRVALEGLRDRIVALIDDLGGATPAQLRDSTGLTRKYLIPVLEWLDGAGYTVRDGDVRRLGAKGRRPQAEA
jgi:selenocysteine-specific elongation factor